MEFNLQEQKIINYLKLVVKNYSPDTTLRIAGGYIRDKLLGLDSHDIDIAIDNMSGQEFAKLIIEQLDKDYIKHSNLHVISARPDQSKHLETTEFNLFGTVLDFVNLRKETYSKSRIPTIEIGTPEEDANRRDLTINALFYNINTGEIEDFTGKGLSDLRNGICRTPIDPLQTFIDDPLRVLRMIRFSSKLNFSIDPEAITAAKNETVHEAFKTKISKERIWTEMVGQECSDGWKHGFLTGPNPSYAAQLLHETGFRDLLFRPKDESCMNPWDTDQNSSYHDLNIWDHTIAAFKYLIVNSLAEDGVSYRFSDEEIAIRHLSMILHDIGKCCHNYIQKREDGFYSYKEHEVGSAKISEELLDRLSAPIDIKKRVIRLVAEHMRLHMLPDNASDKSLRRFIRDLDQDWSHSVDIAIADAYGKKAAFGRPEIALKYIKYKERIRELLANQNNSTKPIRPINGHDLMNLLGMKPGPKMGQVFAVLDEALLENPEISKEEALEICGDAIKNPGR